MECVYKVPCLVGDSSKLRAKSWRMHPGWKRSKCSLCHNQESLCLVGFAFKPQPLHWLVVNAKPMKCIASFVKLAYFSSYIWQFPSYFAICIASGNMYSNDSVYKTNRAKQAFFHT